MGLIILIAQSSGTMPVERIMLNNFAYTGINLSGECLKNSLIIWSIPDDLWLFNFLMAFVISWVVKGLLRSGSLATLSSSRWHAYVWLVDSVSDANFLKCCSNISKDILVSFTCFVFPWIMFQYSFGFSDCNVRNLFMVAFWYSRKALFTVFLYCLLYTPTSLKCVAFFNLLYLFLYFNILRRASSHSVIYHCLWGEARRLGFLALTLTSCDRPEAVADCFSTLHISSETLLTTSAVIFPSASALSIVCNINSIHSSDTFDWNEAAESDFHLYLITCSDRVWRVLFDRSSSFSSTKLKTASQCCNWYRWISNFSWFC